MDVDCRLRLHYRLMQWAATSASRAISAVTELLVKYFCRVSHGQADTV